MTITFIVSSSVAPSDLKNSNFKPFVVPSILPQQQNETRKQSYKLIQTSLEDKDIYLNVGSHNSFVMTAFQCYSQHHQLEIRPDDVWIAICTQFSNYVNGHSQDLRNKFVNFEGKKELTVYGSGTLMSANYVEMSREMAFEIAKNIKDPSVREWIIPDFSTTTPTDRMCGAVMLMATTKSYFDFKFMLLCGLPSVTLHGTVEDWIKLREKAQKLLEFDLKEGHMTKWSLMLFPILDQFVNSAKGNPDTEWWNRIAHTKGGGSGPTYLSGWITAFCVFDDKGRWHGDEKSKNDGWGRIFESSEWPIVDLDFVPRGFVNVPITVNDNGVTYKTEMFAGHMCSMRGDEEPNVALKPRVDWAFFVVEEE
ncbi:hypothetical protein FDP41_010300 [Naegleria fowleri]|uniref:DUF4419 domain-containing protein n=1 Tax=Naegleria fowleri TaxID=5763 RepID=A0A6A5CD10_NAEFO|nr:uncharacterized protein FDP41_010300 [Naegleria fowleri]KAF0983235.1 hypothetical protein FDP41_010300 [Naegleria fowleri]CAG4718811.1 unnamed protein product [Naegleria fowleri]